jgi:2-amino-4-hydroxy-6-hydroxymethyldihydropteridine diphosphokinase
MARVFLSLGSTTGDRRAALQAAVQALQALEAIEVVAQSAVYETEPWPEEEVPREQWALACAVEIQTGLPPYRLLELAQAIEGQVTGDAGPARVGVPRRLDIDILLYEDQVLADYRLQIPHPLLHERRFVLEPLAEIAPEVEHPVLYLPIRDLLALLDDERGLHPYRA